VKALDPFHDEQILDFDGMPDSVTANTLRYDICAVKTITKPASTTAGQPWDCNICATPVIYCGENSVKCSPTFTLGTGNGSLQCDTATLANSRFGAVTMSACDQGTNSFDPSNTTCSIQSIDLANYFAFTENTLPYCRIVSMGYEVVNATPQLTRGGRVTAYRYEPGSDRMVIHAVNTTTGVLNNSFERRVFRGPPNTVALASTLPGSMAWPAERGSYSVCRVGLDSPFDAAGFVPWLSVSQVGPAGADTSYASNDSLVVALPGTAIMTTAANLGYSYLSDIDAPGVYFTGLSPETVLEVTLKLTIERVPTPINTVDVALAAPSARYDPAALELYRQLVGKIAPACPQDENPAGEWFRRIFGKAIRALPAIAAPLASGLGGLANSIVPSSGDALSRGVMMIAGNRRVADAVGNAVEGSGSRAKRRAKAQQEQQRREPARRVPQSQ